MQYLALVRRRLESFTEAEFAALLDPEAARVRELYAEGHVRAIHSRGDVLGAVLFVEASDLDAAHAILRRLPLVEREMAEVETLVPLRPYRGFVGT